MIWWWRSRQIFLFRSDSCFIGNNICQNRFKAFVWHTNPLWRRLPVCRISLNVIQSIFGANLLCFLKNEGAQQDTTEGPSAKYTRLPALLIKMAFFSPEKSLSNCHCHSTAGLRHVFLMGINQRTKPLLLSSCSGLIPQEIKCWTQMVAIKTNASALPTVDVLLFLS